MKTLNKVYNTRQIFNELEEEFCKFCENNLEFNKINNEFEKFISDNFEELITNETWMLKKNKMLKYMVYEDIDTTKKILKILKKIPIKYIELCLKSKGFVVFNFVNTNKDLNDIFNFLKFIENKKDYLINIDVQNCINYHEQILYFYKNYNLLKKHYSIELFYKLFKINAKIFLTNNLKLIDTLSNKDENTFYEIFKENTLENIRWLGNNFNYYDNASYLRLLNDNFIIQNNRLYSLKKPVLKKAPSYLIKNHLIKIPYWSSKIRVNLNEIKLKFEYSDKNYTLHNYVEENKKNNNLYYMDDFIKLGYKPANIDGERMKLLFIRKINDKNEPFISVVCIGKQIISTFPKHISLHRDYPDVEKFVKNYLNEKAIV